MTHMGECEKAAGCSGGCAYSCPGGGRSVDVAANGAALGMAALEMCFGIDLGESPVALSVPAVHGLPSFCQGPGLLLSSLPLLGGCAWLFLGSSPRCAERLLEAQVFLLIRPALLSKKLQVIVESMVLIEVLERASPHVLKLSAGLGKWHVAGWGAVEWDEALGWGL